MSYSRSSRWDTSRIAEIKSTTGDDPTSASSASYDTHTGAFQPFAKFPAKQERYEQFLLARKANKKVELVYDMYVSLSSGYVGTVYGNFYLPLLYLN